MANLFELRIKHVIVIIDGKQYLFSPTLFFIQSRYFAKRRTKRVARGREATKTKYIQNDHNRTNITEMYCFNGIKLFVFCRFTNHFEKSTI